jgi:hypothetical protein
MASRILARDVLSSINLGSEQGSNDLQSYFVESTAWSDLINDEADLILGRKGSGKTKLYRQLQKVTVTKTRDFSSPISQFPTTVIPLISSQLDDEFRKLLAVAGDEEELMKTGWLLQIGILACVHLLRPKIESGQGTQRDTKSLKQLRELLEGHIQEGTFKQFINTFDHELKTSLWKVVVRKLNQVKLIRVKPAGKIDPQTGKLEFVDIYVSESESEAESLRAVALNLIRSLNEVLQEREERFWVVVDSLDELLYGIQDEHSNAAVRSLLRAIIDIRTIANESNYDNKFNLRLKVFAREDVIERMTVTAPFPGLTTIPTARIAWTRREIAQMIEERILSSQLARDFYSIVKVRNEPEIFVSQVFTGEPGRNFVSELIRDLSDGGGSASPRNIIGCLKRALDISRNENHLGEKYQAMTPLVSQSNIDKAKNQTSLARLDDTIKAEYPHLIPLIERLNGAPYSYVNTRTMENQLELPSEELEPLLWWSDLAGLTQKDGRRIQVVNVYRRALHCTVAAVEGNND